MMSATTNQRASTAMIDPVEKRTNSVRIPTNPAVIARIASMDAMSYYLWEAIIHEQTHIVVKRKLIGSMASNVSIVVANPGLTRRKVATVGPPMSTIEADDGKQRV
jgi:hypothetical protein